MMVHFMTKRDYLYYVYRIILIEKEDLKDIHYLANIEIFTTSKVATIEYFKFFFESYKLINFLFIS